MLLKFQQAKLKIKIARQATLTVLKN